MSARSIVIASWDGGGNTGPAIYLGERLQLRGNSVRLVGWESMRSRSEDAGLEFLAYPSVRRWPACLRHEDGWARMEGALFGPETEADIGSILGSDVPDVLVLDCMLTAGLRPARELDIRTVSLVHVLYEPFVHGWGDGVLGRDVSTMLDQVDRVLALTPPGLEPDEPARPNLSFVGAITKPIGRSLDLLERFGLRGLTEPGDPWVLVSFGTTLQRQAEALPRILDALSAMRVRVLVTLADVLEPDAVAMPANASVARFVPHEAVLPFVDLVLAHGGLTTITTSLAFGVPLICLPQGREQPLNARALADVGAGLELASDADMPTIRSAVAQVLYSPAIRTAARAFSDRTAGEDAARIVEEVAEVRALAAM